MIDKISELFSSSAFLSAVAVSWVITTGYSLVVVIRAAYVWVHRVVVRQSRLFPPSHVRAPSREWTEVDHSVDDE